MEGHAMPKLLIVDDEEATVDMLTTYLQIMGHQPIGAYSGSDGLVLAEVETPDLLILDLMMPDLEGIEVCRRLRQHPKLGQLPVLIISARTDRETMDKAISHGANGYLTKPIDFLLLNTEIARLLTSANGEQTEAVS
jgi:DNA-binding response OmpR family regulator